MEATSSLKPLVSLVLPAYNEAAILEANLNVLSEHVRGLERDYRWEIIVVDDGSTDGTGQIAEALAKRLPGLRVLHHPHNFGLGQALRFAFSRSRGDYVVVMDVDLSYSPDHIEKMLERMRQTGAKVVLASPYVDGGSIVNVPWWRKAMSVWANRFLALFARDRYRQLVPRGRLSTLTGMVRAYDGRFLRGLKLRAMSMEINPEIIYKAMLMRGRIEEIPARLDWGQVATGGRRRSSMKVLQHTLSILIAGFVFRPFMFLILPGAAILGFAAYVNVWVLIHFLRQYLAAGEAHWFLDRASLAMAAAFTRYPHTFVVGGLSLVLGIQLMGLGILAMQNKKYFEELFYLVNRASAPHLPEDGS